MLVPDIVFLDPLRLSLNPPVAAPNMVHSYHILSLVKGGHISLKNTASQLIVPPGGTSNSCVFRPKQTTSSVPRRSVAVARAQTEKKGGGARRIIMIDDSFLGKIQPEGSSRLRLRKKYKVWFPLGT